MSTMTKTRAVDCAAIKEAIEGRDGRMLASFYGDNAVLRVIDRSNPPSKPRVITGKAEIDTFWEDICSRAMTHSVEAAIGDTGRIAFTQACTYPDGAKVYCATMMELENGRIARQTVVQAWDE
jgi:hypothetical protein